MISVLANSYKRPVKDPGLFFDALIKTLAARREAMLGTGGALIYASPMGQQELAEWLRFYCWYEQEAASFIESWLRERPESATFIAPGHDVADKESNYRFLLAHLASVGETMDNWAPEPEWVNWISEFYASGDDIPERIAAHHITGEPGAIEALHSLIPRVPPPTRVVLERVLGDEQRCHEFGRKVVLQYATTVPSQARFHARIMRAFELKQKSRLAFARRIRAIEPEAANDL